MPWTCKGCGVAVQSDHSMACPACGQQKTSWTIAAVTRTIRVARRGFTLRRGTEEASRPPGTDPATEVATEGRVLARDHADHLRACGHAPASADTLYVSLAPQGAKDLTVRGEVLFAGRPSDELELPLEAPDGLPKDAVVLVPLVLVRGPGPEVPRDAFAGLTVVDVDEPAQDGAPGHAPTLEVEALGRPRQSVALAARELEPFPFSD